jgi:hypothetical protein
MQIVDRGNLKLIEVSLQMYLRSKDSRHVFYTFIPTTLELLSIIGFSVAGKGLNLI